MVSGSFWVLVVWAGRVLIRIGVGVVGGFLRNVYARWLDDDRTRIV